MADRTKPVSTGFGGPLTQVGDNALPAKRCSCTAGIASVKNEQMVCISQIRAGRRPKQSLLYCQDGTTLGETRPVGHPVDMGINRDGRFSKRGIQHNVRGLSAHPRKTFQGGPIMRYPTRMLFQQDRTGLDDIDRFGIEQANRPDVRPKP